VEVALIQCSAQSTCITELLDQIPEPAEHVLVKAESEQSQSTSQQLEAVDDGLQLFQSSKAFEMEFKMAKTHGA
jgi:hypothetical protein